MKFLFCALIASCFATIATSAFDVVKDGNAQASIFVSESAPPAEKKAAEELSNYLRKITGQKLPLVHTLPESGNRIAVGTSGEIRKLLPEIDFTKLKTDEIMILSPDKRTLIVTGNAPRGTLYAVYMLLEELGVRFWSPENEFIPSIPELSFPGWSIRYAPPFDFREAFGETAKDRLWSVKLRLNGSLWLDPIPKEYGSDRVMDMRQSLTNNFVKPDAFFAKHPDWYAFRKKEGRRVPKQLCMTNPEGLDRLTEEVRAELRAHPEKEFISVAFPDNNICCECEHCAELVKKQGAVSALSIYGANHVARAIAKEFPNVRVMILAYWPTERPPESIEMEPNTGVVFAMLDRNHGLPPAATARHNPYLQRWKKLSHNNVYVWDYYATFGNFLLPMPNLYIMQDAFRTYRDNGVRGVFVQLPWGSLADFVDLRCYLNGKLAWNPDLNVRALVAEYLKGNYGAAAPAVQSYIDLLEKARDRKRGTWIGVYSEKTAHWLTPADLLRARDLFDKALKATSEDPASRRRVEKLRASVLMVSILRYDELAKEAAKQKHPLPSRDMMVEDLEKLGSEFKCTTYKEWDSFKNLIKRLRKTPAAKKDATNAARTESVSIGSDRLTGKGITSVEDEPGVRVARLAPDSKALGFPFMQPDKGEIGFSIPQELAGEWQVAVKLRVSASIDQQPDAAYLGIYAPHEICRQPFSVSPGERGWQTVSLGCWNLPKDSRIWVMPGVTAPVDFIDVRSITLQPVL